VKPALPLVIAIALAASCCGGDDGGEPPARVGAALKTAAGAQELYSTLHGSFTSNVDELAATANTQFPEGVHLEVTLQGTAGYCIQASEEDSGLWHLSRELPVVSDGGC
jgi:hypothetical protein